MLSRKENSQKMLFAPHLTTPSALPSGTAHPEIAFFHLNVACCFDNNAHPNKKT